MIIHPALLYTINQLLGQRNRHFWLPKIKLPLSYTPKIMGLFEKGIIEANVLRKIQELLLRMVP